MQVLAPDEYLPRIAAHEARAEYWTGPRVARRARGEYHPCGISSSTTTPCGHRT